MKDTWAVDTSSNTLIGNGEKYDFNRKLIFQGTIHIPVDSVAIFETNKKIKNPEAYRIIPLVLLAGWDISLGIFCLANPKACFGSCPTFYLNENDNFHYADAEGFSNAISPSLEYYDIDALYHVRINNNHLSITMKNEAFETHCVKEVKILAYPLNDGERVYQSPTNDFYLCKNHYTLSRARAIEGDITALLKRDERQERFSLADEKSLSRREEINLEFDDIKDTQNLGLILHFRQTLMTTYLFYSALGYMGDNISDFFAMLESDSEKRNMLNAIVMELGKIEVYMWQEQENNWKYQDAFYEAGPISINKHFILLKNSPSESSIKLKLVLNKGLWRIDYVALTNMIEKVQPMVIPPSGILIKGKLDETALDQINHPEKYLVSMPGSEYKFIFKLPDIPADYEIFLYSKGYYLEWIRKQWLKEKNISKLKRMVNHPKQYLKKEAKNYKNYELRMEKEFWNSKIDPKIFSYYEN